jgi:predicted AAA+ superfamily ATPase
MDDFTPLAERQDVGQLWENYMVSELYKHRRNTPTGGQFYFWRSRGQAEVDLVIRSGGNYEAYEFKYNPEKRVSFPASFIERYKPKMCHLVDFNKFYEV